VWVKRCVCMNTILQQILEVRFQRGEGRRKSIAQSGKEAKDA